MTTANSVQNEAPVDDSSEAGSAGHQGHERPSYDDINTPVIVLVGVISALVTFLTIAFVEGLSYHWKNRLVMESDRVVNTRQVKIIDDQKAKLAGDPQTGVLSLEEVLDEVIAKYNNQDGKQSSPNDQKE